MEILCLIAGSFALLAALGATALVRALALRIGFVDQPGPRKIHTAPMPYGGGVALALGLAASLALIALLLREVLTDPGWSEWKQTLALAQVRFDPHLVRLLWICLAGAMGALLLGLVDDRISLSPWAKLAGQFVLASAVVAGGVRATALIGDTFVMQAATVLWIVLITNSFNLLDNMDGLCSGNAAIGSAVLALVALEAGEAPAGLLLAALSGACIGFLAWNLAPARIFLGDAGSMFAGFLMASLSVVITYYHYEDSLVGIGVPFMVLAIPLYDTASVMAIRLREGRSLLVGDTSHFSHRLVDLGMTKRQAVATIHLAALAIALPAPLLSGLDPAGGLLLVGQSILVLTLIALLERAGRIRREQSGAGDGA